MKKFLCKNIFVILIFVILIFVASIDNENVYTTKISRFTVCDNSCGSFVSTYLYQVLRGYHHIGTIVWYIWYSHTVAVILVHLYYCYDYDLQLLLLYMNCLLWTYTYQHIVSILYNSAYWSALSSGLPTVFVV